MGNGIVRRLESLAEKDAALIDAAGQHRLEDVQRLLSQGASPDARGQENATPLILASKNGDMEIVGALLSEGAGVNLATDTKRNRTHGGRREGDMWTYWRLSWKKGPMSTTRLPRDPRLCTLLHSGDTQKQWRSSLPGKQKLTRETPKKRTSLMLAAMSGNDEGGPSTAWERAC